MRTPLQKKASRKNFYNCQIAGIITTVRKITKTCDNLVIKESTNCVKTHLEDLLKQIVNSETEDWHE